MTAAVDPAIVALADELRFYLDWLAVLAPPAQVGLDICYPVVSVDGPPLEVRGLIDIELAGRLIAEDAPSSPAISSWPTPNAWSS